jgi:hypothetical protein
LEFQRVFRNFAYEASREAIAERRRLLAHASAGVLDPFFTIAQKARIERTMRELDPEDVRLLQKVACAASEDGLEAAYIALHQGGVSTATLIASGCVQPESDVDLDQPLFGSKDTPLTLDKMNIARVTTLGAWILTACRTYLLATNGPALPSPGSPPAVP